MYCLPSASQKYGPCARSMKRGVPPTERNARTGEFTPPGMVCLGAFEEGFVSGHGDDWN